MDDIAQQAGVAKATVYLRWKTREELFVALLQRERVAWAEEIRQRIHDDPEGLTLRGIFKHTALALIHHPLMRAALMRDREVLGKLAHLEQSTATDAERLMGLTTFLEVLRAQHLVRTDFSLRAQVYLLSTIFAGSFLVAPLVPDAFSLADEELADLMAETASCTLEVDRAGPPGAFQNASRAFLQYLDQTIALYKHALSEEESRWSDRSMFPREKDEQEITQWSETRTTYSASGPAAGRRRQCPMSEREQKDDDRREQTVSDCGSEYRRTQPGRLAQALWLPPSGDQASCALYVEYA